MQYRAGPGRAMMIGMAEPGLTAGRISTLAALVAGKNDPGFVHNGPLAGLVAVCAGSDVMHPLIVRCGLAQG